MDKVQYLQSLGKKAKQASYQLSSLTGEQKHALLSAVAKQLTSAKERILAANEQDVATARNNGLDEAMLDRLRLDSHRLDNIICDIDNVISLADPVGTEMESRLLDNGLRLSRRRVPLGVIGVIYEARPNVTVDIAILALKTGNAVILRGGKETLLSNLALSQAIRAALVEQGLPENAVQLIDSTDRALVTGLLKLDKYVDMIVPRGGQRLQELCIEQATIPVILGGAGICHIYADRAADVDKSIAVIENAKVHRPTVCNALDTLLVHETLAEQLLPAVYQQLTQSNVKFYACEKALKIAQRSQSLHEWDISLADETSYSQEWLSLTLNIKVVSDIDEAIAHIRQHWSGHSEAILTDDIKAATQFINEVDASAVYVNASTRFTDGGQFGLGAEVAVSTQKLHARGPMGLEALTTYKWLAWGDYTARQ